jgi:hypothetical protein
VHSTAQAAGLQPLVEDEPHQLPEQDRDPQGDDERQHVAERQVERARPGAPGDDLLCRLPDRRIDAEKPGSGEEPEQADGPAEVAGAARLEQLGVAGDERPLAHGGVPEHDGQQTLQNLEDSGEQEQERAAVQRAVGQQPRQRHVSEEVGHHRGEEKARPGEQHRPEERPPVLRRDLRLPAAPAKLPHQHCGRHEGDGEHDRPPQQRQVGREGGDDVDGDEGPQGVGRAPCPCRDDPLPCGEEGRQHPEEEDLRDDQGAALEPDHRGGEGHEQGRGEGVPEHVDRGGDAGVAGRLRLEPRPSPPENEGEERPEAAEHHDSLAVGPDEVLQRGRVLAERLADLLPDLLHLRRARDQLPERDALHLEQLLGLERLRLRHAGQRVGDAHPDRGHLGLRGQQLRELGPRLCVRRIDGGAQRGDALQDRSRGAILAGLCLGERPDLVEALELLSVLVDGAGGRLEPVVPLGKRIIRALQHRTDVGEVPLRRR